MNTAKFKRGDTVVYNCAPFTIIGSVYCPAAKEFMYIALAPYGDEMGVYDELLYEADIRPSDTKSAALPEVLT